MNLLAGLQKETISNAMGAWIEKEAGKNRIPKNWDGKVSKRIIDVILQWAYREQ
jgi:hypothetical protein